MKNLILIIAVIVLSACATTTTMKSVAGTYVRKEPSCPDTLRFVLLDNGIWRGYDDGKKEVEEGKWKITNEGELHADDSAVPLATIYVFRINKDGSLTCVAEIWKRWGEREDLLKEEHFTLKKIR